MWKNSTRKILLPKERRPLLLWGIIVLLGLMLLSGAVGFLGLLPGIAGFARVLCFIFVAGLALTGIVFAVRKA